MQFFNFTLRFGQVSWSLKVLFRISEETPKQKPLRFAYGLRAWIYLFSTKGKIHEDNRDNGIGTIN